MPHQQTTFFAYLYILILFFLDHPPAFGSEFTYIHMNYYIYMSENRQREWKLIH